MTAPETLTDVIFQWFMVAKASNRPMPEQDDLAGWRGEAESIAAAVTTWLGQQGDVTDEQMLAVGREGVDAEPIETAHAIRSLLAQQAAVKDAEIERLRKGLWDCFVASGGDPDGKTDPRGTEPLVELAVEGVELLRGEADELTKIAEAAEATVARQAAALDAVRAAADESKREALWLDEQAVKDNDREYRIRAISWEDAIEPVLAALDALSPEPQPAAVPVPLDEDEADVVSAAGTETQE